MKKKLGEILVTTGAVSGADVDAALREQSAGEPSRLGDLLVATGKLNSAQLARALAEQYHLPFVELPSLPEAVIDLVPLDLQRQFRFVPLKSVGTELFIAMADMGNIEVLAVLEQQWTKVHVHVAGGDEIDALHATLSGEFTIQGEELPPSSGPPSAEDLFGSLELDPLPDLSPTTLISEPSAVPLIAPVQSSEVHAPPRPSPATQPSAPPRAEDLFGDLNLESARTGIPAKAPEELVAEAPELSEPSEPSEAAEPLRTGTRPLGLVVAEPHELVVPVEAADAEPVVAGVPESTGALLDMLMKEGTGPVLDTPFFRDASVGPIVPTMSDAPFVSSRSSLSALAIPPPAPTVPAPEVTDAAPPEPPPSPAGEPLPDWLRTESPPPQAAPSVRSTGPGEWTGALDHLMPSKLVVGLTRALLARGLVTEEEILEALGQKK